MMEHMRPVLALLALFLFILPAWAALPESELKVFAVAPDGSALAATLNLQIKTGTGQVWSSVSGPLVGTATQSTEKIAVKLAKNYSSNVSNYDYFFTIDSEASVVDGPSAGSAMTLLVISALQDKPILPHVGLTGTITNTGEVGPVGGVFEKAKEASQNGIKLFLIPEGESRQVVRFPEGVRTVNLPEYALDEWGMKIVETRTMDDVLKYAHTPLEDIDINLTVEQQIPTYIPEKITVNPTEEPLGEMNKQSIQQTREIIQQAQTALNQTLLEDPGLIEVLSRSLSDSEETMNEAELLTQNGYYYSAGNFAFLAKINAYFVRDVSENPELLDLESGKLKDWANDLSKKIAQHQKVLDQTVTIEGVEWYIAGQQRLTWAEQKVDELLNSPVIIVSTQDAAYTQAVQRVQDYEFAKGWFDSSQAFYQISLPLSTKSLKSQEPFEKYYKDILSNAEKGVELVPTGEDEDALRRLEAAQIDQEKGRHLSAAMNAASSLALVNASLMQNDPQNDIEKLLEEKISGLEQKMGEKPTRYAWPRLYLDHAKYYWKSATYYKEQNLGTNAASSVASGFSLVLLAENTYEVTRDVQDYYDSLPEARFTLLANTSTNNGDSVIPLQIGPDGKGSITINATNPNELPVTGILLAIIIFLGIVLALSYVSRRAQKLPETMPEQGMKASKGMENKTLFLVDDLEARLFAARQGLRHAQYQHQTGKLSKESFGEVSSHYTEQIRDLTKQVRKANVELRSDSKEKAGTSGNKKEKIPKKEEKNWPTKKGKKANKKN